jgi:hypothetical protein
MRNGALASLALMLFSGCAADDTALTVYLKGLPGVHDDEAADYRPPNDILLTFKAGAEERQEILTPSNPDAFWIDPNAKTTNFSLIVNGRAGPVAVDVQARGREKRPVGVGSASAFLVAEQAVQAQLTLYPADFQANSIVTNTQLLNTLSTGRQIAADGAGNYALIWLDEECQGSGRCDIWARLFDKQGRARPNAALGKKEEFPANPSDAIYDSGAIAMQPDGKFVIGWMRYASTKLKEIYIRSFAADGRGGPHTKLTQDDAIDSGPPALTVLADNRYVVVWPEEIDISSKPGYRIVYQFLDAAGSPQGVAQELTRITNPPSWLTGQQEWIRRIYVAVAGGPDGGFMAAWRLACETKGTNACYDIERVVYNAVGGVGTKRTLADAKSGVQYHFDIAGLSYGYAAAWEDVASATATDLVEIRFRRFAKDGNSLGPEFTINTNLNGSQLLPQIGVRKDDAMLVVWTTFDETVSDPASGVRGRWLLPNGLPVGGEVKINTTTPEGQERATVVALDNAFLVAFEDKSKLGPDTFESGIRSRLLYDQFSQRIGQLGSACTVGQCGTNLGCVVMTINGANDARCVDHCAGAGAPCPNGGVCFEVQNVPDTTHVCLYNSGS